MWFYKTACKLYLWVYVNIQYKGFPSLEVRKLRQILNSSEVMVKSRREHIPV